MVQFKNGYKLNHKTFFRGEKKLLISNKGVPKGEKKRQMVLEEKRQRTKWQGRRGRLSCERSEEPKALHVNRVAPGRVSQGPFSES